MPEYPSLAALRSGLTTDDADERGRAYSAVLSSDVQPSAVLGSEPAADVVDALEGNDVVPAGGGGRGGRPVSEREEEMIDLLKEIRDLLEAA